MFNDINGPTRSRFSHCCQSKIKAIITRELWATTFRIWQDRLDKGASKAIDRLRTSPTKQEQGQQQYDLWRKNKLVKLKSRRAKNTKFSMPQEDGVAARLNSSTELVPHQTSQVGLAKWPCHVSYWSCQRECEKGPIEQVDWTDQNGALRCALFPSLNVITSHMISTQSWRHCKRTSCSASAGLTLVFQYDQLLNALLFLQAEQKNCPNTWSTHFPSSSLSSSSLIAEGSNLEKTDRTFWVSSVSSSTVSFTSFQWIRRGLSSRSGDANTSLWVGRRTTTHVNHHNSDRRVHAE